MLLRWRHRRRVLPSEPRVEAPSAQAKRALRILEQDLEAQGHTRAAASLCEGLEETLTLHRLDMQAPLRDSLRTTNIIESVKPDCAPCAQR